MMEEREMRGRGMWKKRIEKGRTKEREGERKRGIMKEKMGRVDERGGEWRREGEGGGEQSGRI